MKFGVRKPNIKKSIKAQTTGKIKRTLKKAINPLYGKKGLGFINNPKKALYNKVYNKTTIGVNDIIKGEFKMKNNSNNIKENNANGISQSELKNSKKSFWKSGKNITIIILSFLLFCSIIAYGNSDAYKIDELTTQINELNQKNNELNLKIENNQKQITDLQNSNKLLIEEKNKLEDEKQTLEKEKQELTTKIEELEKASSTETTTNPVNNSTSSTSSSSSDNSNTSNQTSPASSSDSDSEMVWVGQTGSKYHNQGCRTLKGNGHQISLQQALSEGREPCKVCH